MHELVSVIIPAYRAERFIRRTVESALAQSYASLEVVIASDDGVDYAGVLAAEGLADERIRCVFTHGVGTGPASARNTALAAARGRIVATLDADDTLAPRALERLVPLAGEHGAAYGRVIMVDDATGQVVESVDRVIPSGPVSLEELLTSQVHTYASIVFDRERVTATWPEWMERWEDVYFFVRCFDDVGAIYHLAEPLYTYHRVPGSICNRPETGEEYREWARTLADRLDRGETLGLGNAASRRVFARFLRSRFALESSFIEWVRAEGSDDYQAFMRPRRALLYDLDARADAL